MIAGFIISYISVSFQAYCFYCFGFYFIIFQVFSFGQKKKGKQISEGEKVTACEHSIDLQV